VGDVGYDRSIDEIYQELAFFHWQIMATRGLAEGSAIGTLGRPRLKSRWLGLDDLHSDLDEPVVKLNRDRINLLSLK
jgi:hypothetical protein